MYTSTFRHQLIVALFRALETRGFALGTTQYLQVQELLQRVQEGASPEQWRNMLAPILAKTPQEQQQFFVIFEQCLSEVTQLNQVLEDRTEYTAQEASPIEVLKQKEINWRRIALLFPPLVAGLSAFTWAKELLWFQNPGLWIATLALGSLVFALLYLIRLWKLRLGYAAIFFVVFIICRSLQWENEGSSSSATEPLSLRFERFSVEPGDTVINFLGSAQDSANQLQSTTPNTWQTSPLKGRYRIDSSGLAIYIASGDAPIGQIDTLVLNLDYAQGNQDTVFWMAEIIEKITAPKVDTGLILELPLPFAETDSLFAALAIDKDAQGRYEWYMLYKWPLKLLLLFLLGGLAYAIVLWDKYRRAKAVVELQRPDRAPYLWNPEKGIDASEFVANDVQPLLTLLRGRSQTERLRLNLALTIRDTVKAGGRIQFRFEHPSLPNDFLLFIDRLDANDHRAQLFDTYYQAFVKAEAPVSRYFYDGDPRLCFNELYPEGISLSELLHRHTGAQLLFVGEGQGFISQLTGRLAAWTSILETFPRRALMLTRALQSWGRREQELQQLLPLMPASPSGLSAVLNFFTADAPEAPRLEVMHQMSDVLKEPFAFQHDLLTDLAAHFEPHIIDWIAACALWPTLHWDLTLHLGAALEKLNTDPDAQSAQLLNFIGIRELTRLPWFVEGRIPDSARVILVEHLISRGLEQALRKALHALLQQAPPPPEEATAYDDYRMNLILNELFLKPAPAIRRKLEREFARYLAAGKKPDFVALKLLNRPQTPLDILITGPLKKFAFREGLPGLGWNLMPKLLGIWLLLALGVVLFNPNLNPCSGNKVTYHGQLYCLNSAQDSLLYLEQLIADAILEQNHEKTDSLIIAADDLIPRDTAIYLNTATRYYNYAAGAFNCAKVPAPSCASISADSLKSIACFNFQQGGQLFSSLMGRQGVQYFQGQERACNEAVQNNGEFEIHGLVEDALDQRPIAGARIRLGTQSVVTDIQGQYRFRLPSAGLPTILMLRATAPNNYQSAELRTPPQNELPPIRLTPLNASQDRLAWVDATKKNTPEAYAAFLESFPNSQFAVEARRRLDMVINTQEKNDWNQVQQQNTLEAYQRYLDKYPRGVFVTQAQNRINALRDDVAWGEAQRSNSVEACRLYLQNFPQGRHANEARKCANIKPEVPRPAMVRVQGGSFEMGDVFGEGEEDEKPVHMVTLSDFEIGSFEVTCGEYKLFCVDAGKDQCNCKGENQPATYVNWLDAIEYCNWLSLQHGYQVVYRIQNKLVSIIPNANGYRLPTEAEWEYAAREGGKKIRFGNGKNIADPRELNIDGRQEFATTYSTPGTYRQGTVAVGSLKSPNSLGLNDLAGNVFEWCWDNYENYSSTNLINPAISTGDAKNYRVLRGGSWNFPPKDARNSKRKRYLPEVRLNNVGFRLVR